VKRELSFAQLTERSITKKYRKTLWNPCIAAIKRYALIQPGDKIAVCVSGGKDSMLLAKMMQVMQKYAGIPFDLQFLAMDPGYSPENRKRLEENAALLEVPLTVFETDIFDVTGNAEKSPCYLCARMRRGHLYSKARELGCNKIALGHHFNDVIETALLSMFYGAQLQAMPPMLRSGHYPGMTLIRPLYCVQENDIIAWQRYHRLTFLQCACRLTKKEQDSEAGGKRREIKALIRTLQKTNPNIENNIFASLHAVCLDTFPGYKHRGKAHSFLEEMSPLSEED